MAKKEMEASGHMALPSPSVGGVMGTGVSCLTPLGFSHVKDVFIFFLGKLNIEHVKIHKFPYQSLLCSSN